MPNPKFSSDSVERSLDHHKERGAIVEWIESTKMGDTQHHYLITLPECEPRKLSLRDAFNLVQGLRASEIVEQRHVAAMLREFATQISRVRGERTQPRLESVLAVQTSFSKIMFKVFPKNIFDTGQARAFEVACISPSGVMAVCGHKEYDNGHCAVMTCPNYVNKF